jgi:hypothetical protein
MQQLLQKTVGVGFWLVFAGLWYLLVRANRADLQHLEYSAQYVAGIAGAVLAVTLWWIRHNTRIYRRKGPRTGRPELAPDTASDRLDRPVRWALEAGAAGVLHSPHLIVEIDGAAKVYVEAP